jgi:hypothetical protein
MTRRILLVAADWLQMLSDTGESLDIGAAGPDGAYRGREAQAVGPLVAALHRAGAIAPAGTGPASRRTRHRTLVNRWRVACSGRCRALAAEFRRRAASLPDDGDDPPTAGPRQRTLF